MPCSKARSTTCFREAATRGTIAPPNQDEPAASGLTVFGVGGLGAGELTYSSALDLLVLFDPERVRHQGRGEAAEDPAPPRARSRRPAR